MKAGWPEHWSRRCWRSALLWPVSVIFAALSALRRRAYAGGWLTIAHLPVPVVVVGNITVGGAGKTPLVIWLARALAARGRRPGIVSRGYGGVVTTVRRVGTDDDAATVGDEPLLLARRAGCEVWVGRDRVAAARALLASNPDCDLILSDDGLQHYRLGRDIEIAVTDGRGFGNGWALPAGPLREPVARLTRVDAVVMNSDSAAAGNWRSEVPSFSMRLAGSTFAHLHAPERTCLPADLAGFRLHAVAAIGNPQRFFDHLTAMGLTADHHSFADHHLFRREDFAFANEGDRILMTEKDGVKCAALAPAETWVLPVTAEVVPDLAALVLEKIDGRPPA